MDKRPSKDEMPNVVMFTNPVTGTKKRMKLQHLPRPFVEAVGIKPGQTVIIKRRIRVAKSTRNQVNRINQLLYKLKHYLHVLFYFLVHNFIKKTDFIAGNFCH